MSNFIVTFTPFFKKNVLRELAKVDSDVSIKQMFDGSRALIQSKLDATAFIKALQGIKTVFVKHIMPVQETGSVSGILEQDKDALLKASQSIVYMAGSDKFAVQCRIATSGKKALEYTSKDVEVFLGQFYANKGNIPSFSDKALINERIKVVSVFISKDTYYMGFSTSEENLNFHCDEHRICSKTGREISRAENKLKEALVKFGIKLDGEGTALDLGAAPGGWTKVLADYGYNVTAVDPGALHPSLADNPKITHMRTRIEKLTFSNYFDIIVNDMNVDPQITAKIMCGLADSLKKGGIAIVTLKLPGRADKCIEEASQILSKRYDVLAVRSLFHNRREVTALVKKKAE